MCFLHNIFEHSYFMCFQIDEEEEENNEIINLETPKTQVLTQFLICLIYNRFHDRLFMLNDHLYISHDYSFSLHTL